MAFGTGQAGEVTSYDGEIWPTSGWQEKAPGDLGMDGACLALARDYALQGGGSGVIVRGGVRVLAWGDLKHRYELKSTTKSIGGLALGLALGDRIVSLDDPGIRHHPGLGVPPASNAETGWLDQITLRHMATHSAGFEEPGSCGRLLYKPGTRWGYSDGGTNWLADCLTVAFGRDLEDLLFERVFGRLGITRSDLEWRENASRDPEIDGIRRVEFGEGLSGNVDALARIGLLYLRGGRWGQEQILPSDFVQAVGRAEPCLAGLPGVNVAESSPAPASMHYGLLWWNNGDGAMPSVPRDTFWSWGVRDVFIFVIPSLDIVVSRAGEGWPGERSSTGYNIIEPFLNSIVGSVQS